MLLVGLAAPAFAQTTHTVSINIEPAMAAEGNSGITDGATVTVTIDPPRAQAFGIELQLGGTATRGDSNDYQYTFTNNVVPTISASNFVPLSVSSNLASLQDKIRINGDTAIEPNETVTVTLVRVIRGLTPTPTTSSSPQPPAAPPSPLPTTTPPQGA